MSRRYLAALFSCAALSGCSMQRIQLPAAPEPPPVVLMPEKPKLDHQPKHTLPTEPSQPLILSNDDQMNSALKKIRSASEKGLVIVMVSTRSCTYCNGLESFLRSAAKGLDIELFVFDMSPNPNTGVRHYRTATALFKLTGDDWKEGEENKDKVLQNQKIGFQLDTYPTIYFCQNGKAVRRQGILSIMSDIQFVRSDTDIEAHLSDGADPYLSYAKQSEKVLEFYLETPPKAWPGVFNMPKGGKPRKALQKTNYSGERLASPAPPRHH